MPEHTGGKMLLRIEDTDRARSTEGAILAILDGLRWLELDWDGEPVYQFARAERHREVAEQLLAEGKAYRCYASAAGAAGHARDARAPRAARPAMTARGAIAIRQRSAGRHHAGRSASRRRARARR